MESWVAGIEFERSGLISRVMKAVLVNPFANYTPPGIMKALLRFGKSELATSNWSDPGGWRSMVISYDGNPRQYADKFLVSGGRMSMALRNRKRLGARLLARLIDASASNPVHVLCLGAGPGQIIIEALAQAHSDAYATLVDLNSEPFEFGRALAEQRGLAEKVHFVTGDVRTDIHSLLDRPPDIVKMLGICEYLTDEQIATILGAVVAEMPPGSSLVVNSLSKAHGTDRFFRRVFGLHMIHRSVEHIQEMMTRAGLGDFYSIGEPLGVYHVIIARKES